MAPRDDFDLETAHVIPAIIRKSIEARERGDDTITAWRTDEPTREFLYVKDAGKAILDATETYNSPNPVNLGSGEEISIRELINMIVEETGFIGNIKWDTTKLDGQPRRKVDTSRAKNRFGWEASTDFREGLRETIEWYKESRENGI